MWIIARFKVLVGIKFYKYVVVFKVVTGSKVVFGIVWLAVITLVTEGTNGLVISPRVYYR